MIYNYEGEFYHEDDDGVEKPLELPMKWTICEECRGEGMSLCDGMRGHAYSAEEFNRDFDEEERHSYFNGGYDTKCESCRGDGKVKEVDWDQLDDETKVELQEHYNDEAAFASEREAERRMGC